MYDATRLVEDSTDQLSRSVSAVTTRLGRAAINPLLKLSIGRRLSLGFLFPILAVLLALGSIGFQSQQLLTDDAIYNQHLFHANSSLSATVDCVQQLHTNILGVLNDADNPLTIRETLLEDQTTTDHLAANCGSVLKASLQQDDLHKNLALNGLLNQAGHTAQANALHTQAQKTLSSWAEYQKTLSLLIETVDAGNLSKAHSIENSQVEQTYANVMTSLRIQLLATQDLVPATHDAMMIEERRLLLIMGLSALCLLAGMALVAWLVSRTVVMRLQRFRSVVQSIEEGEFAARIEVEGRDEIAVVSRGVNTAMDTIVGLLQESRRQHEELAKGEELKRLHEDLQREHEALNQANALLERLSTTDMLTGLPNHRALSNLLEKECARTRRSGQSLSLLFFDGDRFKKINDTYGHAIGDVVLRELGERASGVLRTGDTVGRYGGEEFLVILPETDLQGAMIVAERLRHAVAASPLATQDVEGGIAVTVSIGVASYPTDGVTANDVKDQADQAMYWAKRLGRNQVRTAAEAKRANRNSALKAATEQALDRQEATELEVDDSQRRGRADLLGLMYSLMRALDWREPGMHAHAQEVGELVAAMAGHLGFDVDRTRHAATAAFLHDIGKIALPDRLFQQSKQQISTQEWHLLHQHAELGATIVETIPWLSDIAPAIRYHHARWDGIDVPDGLAGEDIPLEARLISVAEAYHSMISEQPYQPARSVSEALEELEKCAGTQFDPALVPVLRNTLESRKKADACLQIDL